MILAGGRATRLGPLAAVTPKPVLEIGGRPFLFWLMREMLRFGVQEFLFLTGHLADRLEAELRDCAAALPRPAALRFSREPEQAGTGGALWHARALLDPRFLLCNGDSLFDTNLAPLLAEAAADAPETLGRMLLRRMPEAGRYGSVDIAADRITAFRERPQTEGPALSNAGVYALDRRILAHLAPACSLERDVLPTLASAGALRGTVGEGWFIDIGVPDDLARARATLAARLHRRALFLDRDGVLNRDHGYVATRERWEWMPGAQALVRRATRAGWHVFVVTNQSGIARGFYDEAALQSLMTWVADELRHGGGTLDDWRFCPHAPDAGCACRKPLPGMLDELIRAWSLDPSRCVLIGDQPADLAPAAAAGVRGHLFAGGDLEAFGAPAISLS